MDKEFIPYKQALELKELGFDENYIACYSSDGKLYSNELWKYKDGIKAPLYQQAFRWFREKHNLLYTIEEVWEEDTEYYVVEITTHNRVDDFLQECTYEEAELACLKKLIEIVKNK